MSARDIWDLRRRLEALEDADAPNAKEVAELSARLDALAELVFAIADKRNPKVKAAFEAYEATKALPAGYREVPIQPTEGDVA